jgi:tRNA-Thr(GGU) m(6)t(6)A37 methyltransferase TsaA
MRPIGSVVSMEENGISVVEVLPEYAEGLYLIEQMKELDIIFVFDRSEGFDLQVHPRGDESYPKRGVFSTRSPRRPNPLGVTRVRLVKRDGNRLRVRGLDAFLFTPIVDIKAVPGKNFDWRRTGTVRDGA